MVDNHFGAYAYERVAAGRITSLKVTRPSSFKLSVCVTAKNTSKLLQQSVAEPRTTAGKRIGR
jgi:hypothetical protein